MKNNPKQSSAHLQADYRRHAFPTKVRKLGGPVFAKGLSKLAADGKTGYFEPDSATRTRRALDVSTYPELYLEPGTLPPMKVLNFRPRADIDPMQEPPPDVDLFVFEVAL